VDKPNKAGHPDRQVSRDAMEDRFARMKATMNNPDDEDSRFLSEMTEKFGHGGS
jgi:uncharacterized protein with von Willebrand factor type A (vWA) domain